MIALMNSPAVDDCDAGGRIHFENSVLPGVSTAGIGETSGRI